MNQTVENNPFYIFSVAGIYDNRKIPDAEFYLEKELELIKQRIWEYSTRELPCSIVPIFGRTGTGKTFLMHKLSQEAHCALSHKSSAPGNLFISINPLKFLEAKENIGKIVWNDFKLFLESSLYLESSLKKYRPIDICAYKITEKLFEEAKSNERNLSLSYNPFGKKLVDKDFQSLSVFIKLKEKHRDALWKKFSKQLQTTKHDANYIDLCLWILRKSFFDETWKSFEKLPEDFKIGLFTYLGKSKGFAPILVFDQFEDLEILDTNLDWQNRRFILKIFDLERGIQQCCSENLSVPLSLLVIFVHDLKEADLPKHITDRLPKLGNGKEFIALEQSLSNFRQAMVLSESYFSQYKNNLPLQEIEAVENNWRNLYNVLEAKHLSLCQNQITITPRTWIKACYEVWKNLQSPLIPDHPTKDPTISEHLTQSPPISEHLTQSPPISEDSVYIPNVDSFSSKFPEYASSFLEIEYSLKADKSFCLEILENCILGISSLGLPFKVEKAKKYENYIKFTVKNREIALDVSVKRNQGRGCLNEWEEFCSLEDEAFDMLLFLRTQKGNFPREIPEEIEDSEVITGEIEMKDWLFILCLNHSTDNNDYMEEPNLLSELEIPRIARTNLAQIFQSWDLFAPLLKK